MQLDIVDCHFHFYDRNMNHYPFLEKYDPKLALLWGHDYDKHLPTAYLPENYLEDMKKFSIKKLIMAELVSTEPIQEMHFAQALAEQHQCLAGAIANIDLLDPALPSLLTAYAGLPIVRAVRDHLLWDSNNAENCYTRRAGILSEPIVMQSFSAIERFGFNFEFEVYAHEIPIVLYYTKQFPNINFALHCLGWPLNQTAAGFSQWKNDMKALSEWQNVFVKITAIECIFGLSWTIEQITPWIKETIDIFGPERCMFGSHLPITKLSQGSEALYEAYQTIVDDVADFEKQQLFSHTAQKFYRIAASE